MSKYWDTLATNSQRRFSSDDFEMAAYRLISEQVIYYSDRSGRLPYQLFDLYEREFRRVLAPFGVDIRVNRTHPRYACALPRHAKGGGIPTSLTLLALVLLKIFDERTRNGAVNDDGEVECEVVELDELYRMHTKRELPPSGELGRLLSDLRGFGIVRRLDGDTDRPTSQTVLAIRPAIADVLGETALAKLDRWYAAGASAESNDRVEEGNDVVDA